MRKTEALKHYCSDLVEPFHSRRALARALWHALVRGVDTEICRRCGRPVGVVWTADDETWDRVAGRDATLRCVPCFSNEADLAGAPLRWTPGPLL